MEEGKEKIPVGINFMGRSLGELLELKARCRRRLEFLEENRGRISAYVYDKLRLEYSSYLDAVDGEVALGLSEYEIKLAEIRLFSNQLKLLEKSYAERIQELALRQALGEYSREQYDKLCTEHKDRMKRFAQSIEKYKGEQQRLEDFLKQVSAESTLAAFRVAEPAAASPGAADTVKAGTMEPAPVEADKPRTAAPGIAEPAVTLPEEVEESFVTLAAFEESLTQTEAVPSEEPTGSRQARLPEEPSEEPPRLRPSASFIFEEPAETGPAALTGAESPGAEDKLHEGEAELFAPVLSSSGATENILAGDAEPEQAEETPPAVDSNLEPLAVPIEQPLEEQISAVNQDESQPEIGIAELPGLQEAEALAGEESPVAEEMAHEGETGISAPVLAGAGVIENIFAGEAGPEQAEEEPPAVDTNLEPSEVPEELPLEEQFSALIPQESKPGIGTAELPGLQEVVEEAGSTEEDRLPEAPAQPVIEPPAPASGPGADLESLFADVASAGQEVSGPSVPQEPSTVEPETPGQEQASAEEAVFDLEKELRQEADQGQAAETDLLEEAAAENKPPVSGPPGDLDLDAIMSASGASFESPEVAPEVVSSEPRSPAGETRLTEDEDTAEQAAAPPAEEPLPGENLQELTGTIGQTAAENQAPKAGTGHVSEPSPADSHLPEPPREVLAEDAEEEENLELAQAISLDEKIELNLDLEDRAGEADKLLTVNQTIDAIKRKTVKCPACGTMNYAIRWYCEKCEATLTAL